MKTKFALLATQDSTNLNSSSVKKISKCKDVVTIRMSNREESKVKYRSLTEANWSSIEARKIFNLDKFLKKIFELFLINEDISIDDWYCMSIEIFMFTEDADEDFVMKELEVEGIKMYPFTLEINDVAKIAKLEKFIELYLSINSSFSKIKDRRNELIENYKITNGNEQFLLETAFFIEENLQNDYRKIFANELNYLNKIIFSKW
jgi:hypothetical protein